MDKYHEYATPIQVMPHELFYGLIFWLALHDASICNLQARGAIAEQNIVPGLFSIPSKLPVRNTFGLLGERALCVLMRDPDVPPPIDGMSDVMPFRIFIRCFGSDTALANRLASLVTSWHKVGRPTEQNLFVRAYPAAKEYKAGANDIVIKKRWMQFICNFNK
jgi:hypothetical protein